MKITVWQNVDFEGAAAIFDWAQSNGHELDIQKTYLGEELSISDALVILGGPMSVYDDIDFLKPVKAKLKTYINQGAKIYGICLGAQLIADALGANVYSSGTREIGWRDISFIDGTVESVFHWHGDSFNLPENATLLASNNAFINQAFSF
ncbi:MAG: hypothetical protein RL154_1479, partial [Pseudomonadota bacterium]